MEAGRRLTLGLLLLLFGGKQGWCETVESIRIDGLERTRPQTLLRELPFAEGDTWQESMQQEGERRLRNSGLFSDVHISPPSKTGTVAITVNERWSLWLLPEATRKDNGASNAGMALAEHNMWGLNHQFRLAYRGDTGKNFSMLKGGNSEASYFWRHALGSQTHNARIYLARGDQQGSVTVGATSGNYRIRNQSAGIQVEGWFGETVDEGWSGSVGIEGSSQHYTPMAGAGLAGIDRRRRNSVNMGINYQWQDDHITWKTGRSFSYRLQRVDRRFGATLDVLRQEISIQQVEIVEGESGYGWRIMAGIASGEVVQDGLYDLGSGKNMRGYLPGEVTGVRYVNGTMEGRMPAEQGSNLMWIPFVDVGKSSGGNYGRWTLGTGMGMRWTLRWLMQGTLRADVAYGWEKKRWRLHLGTGQTF